MIPISNPDAKFIDVVENLDEELLEMGKGTSRKHCGNRRNGHQADRCTGLPSAAGVDMVIANGADFHVIHKITEGRNYGTLVCGASPKRKFYLIDIIDKLL